ncbi:MAG: hypothetical protein FD129_3034, partial [bacterium]
MRLDFRCQAYQLLPTPWPLNGRMRYGSGCVARKLTTGSLRKGSDSGPIVFHGAIGIATRQRSSS